MNGEKKRRTRPLSWKTLTSLSLVFLFILMIVSGAVLYSAPQGRVANWTGWNVLGADKEAWSALHVNTSILFVIAGLLHVYFNWSLLLGYFKAAVRKGLGRKRELAAALVISLLVCLGALAEWPPFSTVMAWNEGIKDYWEQRYAPAPFPHAELASLDELTAHPNVPIDAEEAIERLRAAGYDVPDASITVEELAEARGKNPSQVFADLGLRARGGGGGGARGGGGGQGRGTASGGAVGGRAGAGGGSGYGRMTVAEAAEESGVTAQTALERLRESGLDARAGDRLRDLADTAGRRSSGVYAIISGQEP